MMKSLFRYISAFLLAVVMSVSCTGITDDNVILQLAKAPYRLIIEGKVYDKQTSAPLDGVDVRLDSYSFYDLEYSRPLGTTRVVTREDGRFEIVWTESVKHVVYTLTVTADDRGGVEYEPMTMAVIVTSTSPSYDKSSNTYRISVEDIYLDSFATKLLFK